MWYYDEDYIEIWIILSSINIFLEFIDSSIHLHFTSCVFDFPLSVL